MAGINFADPYDPNAPPRSMADGFGQRMQGMFGGLSRGFQGGANALNPYSNRLLGFSAGMLGGGPSDAMKGMIAGSALDRESADRRKLNEAIAGLRGGSGVLSGLNEADWNYLQSDPEALSNAFGSRLEPKDPLKFEFEEVDGILYRTDPYSGEAKQVSEGSAGALARPKLSDVAGFRKEFETQPGVTRYRQSIPQLNSMASSIHDTSKMSDYDFVYGLAQIFDPGSVVRESEQGFVLSGQSVPDTVRGQLATILAGGAGVSVPARQALVAAAKRRVEQYRQQAAQEEAWFRQVAEQSNIDPDMVVRGLEDMPELGAAADPNEPFTLEP